MSNFEYLLIKNKITELSEYKGRHSSFTTLYVPHNKPITELTNFLKQEISGASNIKDKNNRKNVIDNLSAILTAITTTDKIPDNGVVFFYGMTEEGSSSVEIRESVIPPVPIHRFEYECGREFSLRTLSELLESDNLMVVILVEAGIMTIGELTGKRMKFITEYTSHIPSQTRAGGQSANRYTRIREGKIEEFYKTASEKLNNLYLDRVDDIHIIIFGGNPIRVDNMLKRELIDYRLREKISSQIVSVSTVKQEGLYQAVKEVSRIVEESEVYKEREQWEEFMELLTRGSTLASYGYTDILDMLSQGRVEKIIILEDDNRIEEIVDISSNYGTEIITFSKHTEPGAQLSSFGIAAILRW